MDRTACTEPQCLYKGDLYLYLVVDKVSMLRWMVKVQQLFCFTSEVAKCSEVLQCSDGLSNKVSNIIRRLTDNMKLLLICILRVLLSHSFIFFRFYFFVNVYMVLFLFDNVIYVFLLLWLCILILCLCMTTLTEGARGSAVGRGTALQVGRSRVRFPMVSLEVFIDIILPAALWPWGRLSL